MLSDTVRDGSGGSSDIKYLVTRWWDICIHAIVDSPFRHHLPVSFLSSLLFPPYFHTPSSLYKTHTSKTSCTGVSHLLI